MLHTVHSLTSLTPYTFGETRVQALVLVEQKLGMGAFLAQDMHADSTMSHSADSTMLHSF